MCIGASVKKLCAMPTYRNIMPKDARNDHAATDLLCGECHLVIATLHHLEEQAEQARKDGK